MHRPVGALPQAWKEKISCLFNIVRASGFCMPRSTKEPNNKILRAITTLGSKIGGLEKTLNSRIIETRKLLEAKIEYSRRDASEHIKSVQKGFSERFDGVENRLDRVENRLDGVENRLEKVEEGLELTQKALKATKDDLTSKIEDVGTQLSEKIDGVHLLIEDHGRKPAEIAHPAHT